MKRFYFLLITFFIVFLTLIFISSFSWAFTTDLDSLDINGYDLSPFLQSAVDNNSSTFTTFANLCPDNDINNCYCFAYKWFYNGDTFIDIILSTDGVTWQGAYQYLAAKGSYIFLQFSMSNSVVVCDITSNFNNNTYTAIPSSASYTQLTDDSTQILVNRDFYIDTVNDDVPYSIYVEGMYPIYAVVNFNGDSFIDFNTVHTDGMTDVINNIASFLGVDSLFVVIGMTVPLIVISVLFVFSYIFVKVLLRKFKR